MESEPEEGELLEDVPAVKKPKIYESLPYDIKAPYSEKSIKIQYKLPHLNQNKNPRFQNPQKPAGFWQPPKQRQLKGQNLTLQKSKPSSQQTQNINRGLSLNSSLSPKTSSPKHKSSNTPLITQILSSSTTSTPLIFSPQIPTISTAPTISNSQSKLNIGKLMQAPSSSKSQESSSIITLPQKRQKVFEPKLQCKFWENGACSKGSSCTFAHIGDIKVKNELCKYFMTGCCTKAELCGYSHDFSKFPCKYFHGIGVCGAGENCKFSHERLKNNEIFEFMKTHESYLKQVQDLKGDTNLGEYFCLYLKSKVN